MALPNLSQYNSRSKSHHGRSPSPKTGAQKKEHPLRVQANHEYIYYPNFLDRIDGRTDLVPGSIVRVANLPGCPKANTMGHAHVEYQGKFAGLVHTNSLHPLSDRQLVIDALKRDLAAKEITDGR
jgi:hypothetical protein